MLFADAAVAVARADPVTAAYIGQFPARCRSVASVARDLADDE